MTNKKVDQNQQPPPPPPLLFPLPRLRLYGVPDRGRRGGGRAGPPGGHQRHPLLQRQEVLLLRRRRGQEELQAGRHREVRATTAISTPLNDPTQFPTFFFCSVARFVSLSLSCPLSLLWRSPPVDYLSHIFPPPKCFLHYFSLLPPPVPFLSFFSCFGDSWMIYPPPSPPLPLSLRHTGRWSGEGGFCPFLFGCEPETTMNLLFPQY